MMLIGVGATVVETLQGRDTPERALGTLLFAAGVAATILMAVAAWMSGNRRARRVAAAVGVYTGVALLLGAVDAEIALVASIAMLGVAGLLLLSMRGSSDRRRDRRAAAGVLVLVIGGTLAAVVTALVAPGHAPPSVVAWADVVAWSATGTAGLLLVVTGTLAGRPLARRTGLAFATLGIAHVAGIIFGLPRFTGALELGAVAMLLLTAAPFLVTSVRAVGRQQEVSRTRLAEVEAMMASVAERDHELRNVVAGLSGAARVLTDEQIGSSVDGRRLLVAAGGELARLQQMLDGPRAASRASEVAVGPLLLDIALVHAATGLDVSVDVEGDPYAAIDPDALAQVLTNLLVNCARHAPGARVRMRACIQGREVRIEVADNGPGLPAGSADAVLHRGVRGPGSTGDGLGLTISAELVERHRGRLALVSHRNGCTAVLELPMAGRVVAAARVGA